MIPKTRTKAFKALGLSEGTDAKEIKDVYCKLMLKWHPDKRPEEE